MLPRRAGAGAVSCRLMRRPLRILLLLVLIVVPSSAAVAADLGTDAYRLPLVEPYAIYRSDTEMGVSQDRGLYQLVEVLRSSPDVGLSTQMLVPRVELIAAHDRVIFGKSADGFFILDARQTDQQPQTFRTRGEWQARLRDLGVENSDAVKVPDALAAGVPAQVLRPWNYRVMGNRFGILDDVWSLIVQLLGFLVAFVLGVVWRPGKSPMLAAAALGLMVNIVAQILIAGGGPGAFVGFVAFPLLCMLAAAIGKGLRAITTGGRPAGG
jgi:hypothetical protein